VLYPPASGQVCGAGQRVPPAGRIRVERESPSPVRETRAPSPADSRTFSPPEAEPGTGFAACGVREPHGPGARVSTAAAAVVPVAVLAAVAVAAGCAAAGAAAARARTGVSAMPSTTRYGEVCEVMGMPPRAGVSDGTDSLSCSIKPGAAYISQDRPGREDSLPLPGGTRPMCAASAG
jgi:hypothetical protein